MSSPLPPCMPMIGMRPILDFLAQLLEKYWEKFLCILNNLLDGPDWHFFKMRSYLILCIFLAI